MRQLIIDRGYDAITLAEVAATAGVGRTAVYNHFPDKESVLLAWAADETDAYLVRLYAALSDDDTPLDRLRTFLRIQMTELAGHHARMAGIGTALSVDGRTRMREHVAPMMTMLRQILTDAIAAGQIPEQDLDSYVPMISGVTAGRRTVGMSGAALDDAIATATDFVLYGIGASRQD